MARVKSVAVAVGVAVGLRNGMYPAHERGHQHEDDMKSLSTILMTTALIALPAFAHAEGRGERMFQRLDANADGQVTTAEVTAAKTEMFTQADANADGLLDADERAVMREAVRQRVTVDGVPGDTDADGNLSLVEFTRVNPLFDRADADGDGTMTRAEFDAIRGQHRP
jgi:tellurite resistance protein